MIGKIKNLRKALFYLQLALREEEYLEDKDLLQALDILSKKYFNNELSEKYLSGNGQPKITASVTPSPNTMISVTAEDFVDIAETSMTASDDPETLL